MPLIKALTLFFVLFSYNCAGMTYLAADDPIAVVGGGAGGILSAHHLAKMGYTNIHLYEKNAKLGAFGVGEVFLERRTLFEAREKLSSRLINFLQQPGVTISQTVEDRVYDLTTIFIPSSSVREGPGISSPLKSLLNQTATVLRPAFKMSALYPIHPMIAPFSPILKKYTTPIIVEQFARGWLEMAKLDDCKRNGQDCVQCEVCKDYSETFAEYGARKKLMAFVDILAHITYSTGGSPSQLSWAGQVLEFGSFWAAPEMAQTLRFLKVKVEDLPKNFPEKFRETLEAYPNQGDNQFYTIAGGYQNFLISLVNVYENSIVTHLRSSVSAITRTDEDMWEVSVGSKKSLYKSVIVATPPTNTVSFFPKQQTIWKNAFPQTWVDIALASMLHTWLPELDFGYSISSTAQGSPKCAVPTNLPGLHWRPHGDRNILYLAALVDPKSDPYVNWISCRGLLQQLGTAVAPTPLHSLRLAWPSQARTNIKSYFKSITAMQGKENLYFVGEHVSGSSIPVMADWTSRFIPGHFSEPGAHGLSQTNESSYATSQSNLNMISTLIAILVSLIRLH